MLTLMDYNDSVMGRSKRSCRLFPCIMGNQSVTHTSYCRTRRLTLCAYHERVREQLLIRSHSMGLVGIIAVVSTIQGCQGPGVSEITK